MFARRRPVGYVVLTRCSLALVRQWWRKSSSTGRYLLTRPRTPTARNRHRQRAACDRVGVASDSIIASLVLVLSVPVWSFAHAVMVSNGDPVGANATEWARAHSLGWLVDDVEHFWYSHHQPPTGGAPKGGIPKVALPIGPTRRRDLPHRVHPRRSRIRRLGSKRSRVRRLRAKVSGNRPAGSSTAGPRCTRRSYVLTVCTPACSRASRGSTDEHCAR